MFEMISAVYENGTLRPLVPLNLREHQRVRLQLWTEEPMDEVAPIIQVLNNTNLLTPPPGHSEIAPLTETERQQLAELLGKVPGKPLSEIIIEERGEW